MERRNTNYQTAKTYSSSKPDQIVSKYNLSIRGAIHPNQMISVTSPTGKMMSATMGAMNVLPS